MYICTPTPVTDGLLQTVLNNMYHIIKEEREERKMEKYPRKVYSTSKSKRNIASFIFFIIYVIAQKRFKRISYIAFCILFNTNARNEGRLLSFLFFE